MTRDEIAKILGYETLAAVRAAINKAVEEGCNITPVSHEHFVETSFTKEDVECICRHIDPPLNELQISLVLDNYIEHEETYIDHNDYLMKGNKAFIESVKRGAKRKACGNCAYCVRRTIQGTDRTLYPYCMFYSKFLKNIKVNVWKKTKQLDIFIDRCDSWKPGEVKIFERRKKKR